MEESLFGRLRPTHARATQHNRVGDDDDRDEADPRARALSPLFAIAEISFPFSFFFPPALNFTFLSRIL